MRSPRSRVQSSASNSRSGPHKASGPASATRSSRLRRQHSCADEARLKACGLSGAKVTYLRDLAQRVDSGVLDFAAFSVLDDEAVIEALVQVKGIGRWTAEMFLIFHMTRPDVFPLDDVGLQRALRNCYNRGRPLSAARMRRLGAAWTPWRSVATWYLWRSLDPQFVQY